MVQVKSGTVARTQQQLIARLHEIDSYDALTQEERDRIKMRLLQNYEAQAERGMENFVKVDVDRMRELKAKIRNDKSRPMAASTVIEILYEVAESIDGNCAALTTPDDLSSRTGVTKNNVYRVLKYLRKIGFLLGDEKGFFDPSVFTGDKKDKQTKSLHSLYYGKNWVGYVDPYFTCKYRSFEAEISRASRMLTQSYTDSRYSRNDKKPQSEMFGLVPMDSGHYAPASAAPDTLRNPAYVYEPA
jgi:hypothetical protein